VLLCYQTANGYVIMLAALESLGQGKNGLVLSGSRFP
jgi:hypothetical protein